MVKQVIAASLKGALEALYEDEYLLFAGGTDLMIQNRSVSEIPVGFKKNVLYIGQIAECQYIRNENQKCCIGANTTLSQLLESSLTPELLKVTIAEMASPAIRNMATLAGNIGNASPAGDSLVPLTLLNALIKVESLHGSRVIPIQEFIIGVRKTALLPHEMITEIQVPLTKFTKFDYTKVGGRKADAISKVSFLGAYTRDGNIITDIRIALGAIYVTVLRSPSIEQQLQGLTISEIKSKKTEIMKAYEPLIQPIDDQRSNKLYRLEVALNLISRFIDSL